MIEGGELIGIFNLVDLKLEPNKPIPMEKCDEEY